MSALDKLLDVVKNRMSSRTGKRGGLFDKLGSLLEDRETSSSPRVPRNVKPASQDPYGDPADEYRGRSVKSASEDPYGDPADEKRRK